MCGIFISGLANRFSSFRSRKIISFHGPVSVREHRWNFVKGVLDHLWAILAVYLCIFFQSHSKIGCRRGKVRGKVYEATRDESCFRLEAGLYPKEDRIRQKNSGMRITKGHLWRETSMKSEKGNKVYVCVFVGHGLRSISFVLGVAKKSRVPICSARTSLTYPSSFC